MVTAPTFGERLRAARLVAGISARELDRIAGTAKNQTANIESREQEAALPRLIIAYATALGVDPTWLGLGLGETPDPDAIRSAVERARAARTPSEPPAGEGVAA